MSFSAFSAPAKTQVLDADTKLVLRSISQRYKKLKSWKATFTQENFSTGLGTGTFNEGRFDFVAPNKFRYSIMRPESSDFISNGKEAWQVVFNKGRDKPAFVRHISKLNKIDLERYLLVLRGIDAESPEKEAQLTKDFTLKGNFIGQDLSLEMIPKKSSEISKVVLIFKNAIEAPYRAVIEDAVGGKTTITIVSFDSLSPDKVDEKTFRPEYPKGSEVEEL